MIPAQRVRKCFGLPEADDLTNIGDWNENQEIRIMLRREPLELVEAVDRGDLVGFRERGRVGNGIAEIFAGTIVAEQGLADVNNLRDALA